MSDSAEKKEHAQKTKESSGGLSSSVLPGSQHAPHCLRQTFCLPTRRHSKTPSLRHGLHGGEHLDKKFQSYLARNNQDDNNKIKQVAGAALAFACTDWQRQ